MFKAETFTGNYVYPYHSLNGVLYNQELNTSQSGPPGHIRTVRTCIPKQLHEPKQLLWSYLVKIWKQI